MNYVLLGVCQALATFAVLDLAISAIVALVWRAVRDDRSVMRARAKANGLFVLRMLPTTTASVVTLGIGWSAFLAFEPRETTESVGFVVGVGAAIGALLLTTAGVRVWRAWYATNTIAAAWRSNAAQIDLPGADVPIFRIESALPIVSVVGVRRAQLFIAGTVLDTCTPHQIGAMVAHESSHLRARDNLRRLILRGCVDPLAVLTIGDEIEQAWADAAEEAADDGAIQGRSITAFDLAEALVSVARLTSPGSLVDLPGAMLSRGSVANRVRRLMVGEVVSTASSRWLAATRVLAYSGPVSVLAFLAHPRSLRQAHEVFEFFQHMLP